MPHTTRTTLAALAATAATIVGCSGGDGGIVGCTDSTVCAIAAGGQCLPAPVGFNVCAYPAAECPSGLAWSPEAGSLAGVCVAQDIDAGTDAPSIDAPSGCNGLRVAFSDGSANSLEVYAANPDGTGITNLSTNAANDYRPHWSKVGNLIAFESSRTGNAEIFTVSGTGSTPRNITQNAAADTRPVFSPDGTKIAFSRQAPGALSPTLWVMNADGSNAREISTLDVWGDTPLSWSPDSTRIAFVVGAIGSRDVLAVGLTGTAPTNLCEWTTASCDDPDWSPDGTQLVLDVTNTDGEIYVINADSSNPTNITNAPSSNEFRPSWSPDGTAIAFSSNRRGQLEIFRSAFPVSGEPTRLTTNNNTTHDHGPKWSPDGKHLAFIRKASGGTAKIATVNADGTNYADFSASANADGPSWSPCQ